MTRTDIEHFEDFERPAKAIEVPTAVANTGTDFDFEDFERPATVRRPVTPLALLLDD